MTMYDGAPVKIIAENTRGDRFWVTGDDKHLN